MVSRENMIKSCYLVAFMVSIFQNCMYNNSSMYLLCYVSIMLFSSVEGFICRGHALAVIQSPWKRARRFSFDAWFNRLANDFDHTLYIFSF